MPRITKIETFTVPPRWILIRVETEDGAVGWGESIVPKRKAAVVGCIADMAGILIGEDASQIEHIAQSLRKGSFFRDGPIVSSALAGIEIALWDLKAKSVGLPIYDFLGGAVREKVRSYAWVRGDNADALVDNAKARQKQGFDAIKLTPNSSLPPIGATAEIDDLVERMGRLRDTFGTSMDIAIDLHGRVSRNVLKPLIKEIEPFSPMWIEEPVTPENEATLLYLARNCPHIPVATGKFYWISGFFKCIETRRQDVVQSDIANCGGIGLIASAHLLAASESAGQLEIDVNANPLRDAFTPVADTIENGHWPISDLPGWASPIFPSRFIRCKAHINMGPLINERSVAAMHAILDDAISNGAQIAYQAEIPMDRVPILHPPY